MTTCRAVVLGLVVALSVGAAPGSAATSTCLAAEPSASSTGCGAAKRAPGAVVTLLPLSPEAGLYQLWITSANADRLTKAVRWTPPADMTVTGITSAENGHCWLSGGRVACIAAKPALSLAVDFTARRALEVEQDDDRAVLLWLDIPRGLFRLKVANVIPHGSTKAFSWVPPDKMSIWSIASSQGGKCALVSGSISCRSGARDRPPACCALTVDFLADGLRPTYNGKYWTFDDRAINPAWICGPMTPCPYHIPNFSPDAVDLPLCKQGQTSTQASPCTKI